MKVEELDDIPKVPAIGGGSEVKANSAPQDVSIHDKEMETGSVKIDTSELPPHAVLDMPALSPTMVRMHDTDNGQCLYMSIFKTFLPSGSFLANLLFIYF